MSEDDVKKLVMSTKSKSSSLDPIPPSILKQSINVLISPITTLINTSLQTGTFPQSWKCGLVTPLLKKPGLERVPSNYRPVTNLPFLSKVLEKAALHFLTPQLNKDKSFSSYNSAYKANFSTETLLTKVLSDIFSCMDKQQIVLLVLLDLSAAFDSVSHLKLKNILKYKFNINNNCINWINSYLTDHHQQIKVNLSLSELFKIEHGVPQGSCLGPIIFLAYISHLYEIINTYTVSVGGYADDHQLYISCYPDNLSITNALLSLETCIKSVRNFFLTHHLLINDSKTEFMIIGSKHLLSKLENIELRVGNSIILPGDSVKNLGVIFDNCLSFENQIQHVTKKSYYHLYRINQIKKYLDCKTLTGVIHSFITCNLDYCNILYFNLPQKSIKKLQKIQNSAARIITNTLRSEHISPSLKFLHWLPVNERITYKIAITVYKSLNNLAPLYLSELISKYLPSRNLRSSHNNLLVTRRINRASYGGRGYSYAASHIWNLIPDFVKNSSSLNIFKNKLKTFLFNLAFN